MKNYDWATSEILDVRKNLPAGVYAFEVVKADQTVTRSGRMPGTPMVKAELKFEGGVRVYENFVLSPDALWRSTALFKALGLEDIDWDAAVGKRGRAVLTTEKDLYGLERNKVKRFMTYAPEDVNGGTL